MTNKFAKNDRVTTAEGWTGTILRTYWDENNEPHGRVDVLWDRGSKSFRPEDGLTKIDEPRSRRLAPAEIEQAKAALGTAWGLSRPLHNSELARALRMTGRDPGRYVQDWISMKSEISGPASVAIEMMLAGALPPDPMETILR